MTSGDLYRRMRAEIGRIPIVDVHEHLEQKPAGATRRFDLFTLMDACHLGALFERLGAPADLLGQTETGLDEKWATIKPLLPAVEATGSYRCVMVAAHDLFEFGELRLDSSNWRDLNRRIVEVTADPDWYRRVLFELSNFEFVFNVSWDFERPEPGIAPVPILTPILLATRGDYWQSQAQQFDYTIEKLGDAEVCIERFFERAEKAGAVAVRLNPSRVRTIAVGNPTRAEASRVFRSRPDEREEADMKAYEDYIFHRALRLAADTELTVQVHAGIQDLGHQLLGQTDPLLLSDVFHEYNHNRFLIDHAGYPFSGEAVTLARCFPNVYVDFVWMPLLGPSAAKTFLHDLLDIAPATKTMWGGDCNHPEAIYAQSIVARDIVAEVLCERVERGTLAEETALGIARMMLHHNALVAHRTSHLEPSTLVGDTE